MTMRDGGGGELTGEVDQRSVSLLAVRKVVNSGVEGRRSWAVGERWWRRGWVSAGVVKGVL
jgi:hypothetical protein